MVSTNKTNNRLLAGIELSDVVSPRVDTAPGRADTSAQADRLERGEAPSITLKSGGLSRKQKLGLAATGLLGLGALTGVSVLAGVERHKNNALRATNLNLQSKVANLTPPAIRVAPQPAMNIAGLRNDYNVSDVPIAEGHAGRLEQAWNLTDPAPELTRGEVSLRILAYADINMPLFNEVTGEPGYRDIQINGGLPAAHASNINATIGTVRDEAVAGAAGALAATDPLWLASLFKSGNVSDDTLVALPLNFKTRANPYGFETAVVPVQNTVLTDNETYARGAQRIRNLLVPKQSIYSSLLPDAVKWFPLLQKQVAKLAEVSATLPDYSFVSTVADVMSLYTGNEAVSSDLTRFGDRNAAEHLGAAGSEGDVFNAEYSALAGVLNALPSEQFDSNIGNLVQSTSRAATFNMRNANSLPFLPNGSVYSAHWDGVFMEPALGGQHLHVRTDDGKVNEVLLADRPYVFLGISEDPSSGDIDTVTLADMTGKTIDCNKYEQLMSNISHDPSGITSWGVYGANETVLKTLDQVDAMPVIWHALPLKDGTFTLPYSLFKKLAVWTDQVNLPTLYDTYDGND